MSRKSVILLSAAALLYVAVRLWRLDASCLWFDEIFSVHAAGHSWDSLWWFAAQDLIHPPLFYAVLKIWMAAGGESLLWLRLLPVLFSAVALAPFIYLCRELKLPNSVRVLALGLLAVNGSLIKYTQTLRMYSMLFFLALLSTWLFARYFYRGKSFVPLIIVNLLLVYTHYFGWLVIGSEVLAILIFQRIKWRRMLVMSGILLASFIPWIIAVSQASSSGSDVAQNIGWMPRPGARQFLTFVFDLSEPFYFQASSGDPASLYRVSVPILLILITATVFYLVYREPDKDRQRVHLLALFALFPAVVAFILSWVLPHSVWGTRHLIVVYVPIALLLAYFVVRVPVSWARTGAITLLLLLYAYAFCLQAVRPTPQFVWCEWENVAGDIKSRSADGPVKIYAFEDLTAYHLWFALRDSERYEVSVVKGVDVRTNDEAYFLPRGFDDVPSVKVEDINNKDIWLAFRTAKAGEDTPLIDVFRNSGYETCPPASSRYDSTTVFWVKMTRSSNGCQ